MSATAHLTWDELACHDGTPYPAEWRESRGLPLAAEFERIRAACGDKPIRIGSAFRTVAHNHRIGGARNSQHVQGRALDLYPPKGMTVPEFARIVREVAGRADSRLTGVGYYPSFVHVDIRPPRPDGRLTVWRGDRAWAELR